MLYYKFLRLESIYYFCEIDYVHKTEKWLPVIGYEGMYEVSDLGRVKSITRYKVKSDSIRLQQINSKGYLMLSLLNKGSHKSRTVHQLVSMAFLNHKPCGYKLAVNHININRLDNKTTNLEIVTFRANTNKKHLKSSSKYTGVSWIKKRNKWTAQFYAHGKQNYLGYFLNEYDAHLAYEKALSEHLNKQNRSN